MTDESESLSEMLHQLGFKPVTDAHCVVCEKAINSEVQGLYCSLYCQAWDRQRMTDLITKLRDPLECPTVNSVFELCREAAGRIEQLEELLRHARCPNKDCGELCECEWCDERKALLAEDRE